MRRAVLVALLALPAALSAAEEGGGAPGTAIPNQFLIRLADSADPEETARTLVDAYGLALMRVYRRVVPGFSALVPPLRVDALRRDPRVRSLGQDRVLGAGPLTAAQPPASTQRIAVFDTGISSGPAALAPRLSAGVTLVSGEASPALEGLDDHGHGTAVAQRLLDSRPEAVLWSVKVLGAKATGCFSDLIAGLDWLLDATAHPRIDAAVFSLGAACPVCRPDSQDGGVAILHEAIIATHDAGVSLWASADAAGAPNGLPGAFPEVSAMAPGVGTAALPLAADPSFGLKAAYAFPNPVRGQNSVTIRIQPGIADSVTMRVYDVAGRKVHESSNFTDRGAFDDGNGKGQQFTYDHVWDISGVGSGVYTYVVTARKAGQSDISKTGKIGIVK